MRISCFFTGAETQNSTKSSHADEEGGEVGCISRERRGGGPSIARKKFVADREQLVKVGEGESATLAWSTQRRNTRGKEKHWGVQPGEAERV